MRLAVPALAALLLGSAAARAADPPTRGRVEGRVAFAEAPDPFHPLTVTTQVHACGAEPKPNKMLRVGPEGGLADCVVTVPALRSSTPQGERPVLDQVRCEFRPHVLVVRPGEPFEIRNSDPVLHNVHGLTLRGQYTRFNVGLPPDMPAVIEAVDREEPIALRCDAGHRWMRGYVFPTASAHVDKSGEDGAFTLEALPPGEHRVEVWHPLLGEVRFPVTVRAGETTRVTVGAALHPRLRLEAPRP